MKNFSINDLLQAAKQRAGLDDFGPGDFKEGLTVLIEGLNNDVKIVDDRRDKLRDWLVNLLVNRLRFQHDLNLHPEILHEDLGTPVIISSMPRTASTKLHRMLASTGDFQFLKYWSVYNFARIPGLPDGGMQQRIQETLEFEQWMHKVCPQMLNGHPHFTHEAEEEIFLNECTFKTQMLASRFGGATYQNWLPTTDFAPSYDYLRTQLQYLQWQDKGNAKKRWLLKAPGNFGMEKRLTNLYGDASFVVTHRDPVKCIPSISSVTRGTRELFVEAATYEQASVDMLNFFSHQVKRHMRWRDQNPSRVLDLAFDEITLDGVSAARKFYTFLDMPLSTNAENAILAWEKNNPKGKHGGHKYSIENSGLTEAEITESFKGYIEQYSKYF